MRGGDVHVCVADDGWVGECCADGGAEEVVGMLPL